MSIKSIFLFCYLAILAKTVLSKVSQKSPDRVIIDIDGGVDDFHALTYLLNADTQNLIKIEAILCVHGNTELEHVKNNVIRFLETAGRLDIPVYSGSHRSLVLPEIQLERWFGLDGFGDLEYEKWPNLTYINDMNAVEFLNVITDSNPHEITLILLGPLTNIGIAASLYTKLMNNVKDIFIMGGNYGEAMTEFNFLGDPEAAHTVFNTTLHPTTILPWQACSNSGLNLEWRFNISVSNPIFDLIDAAERSQFVDGEPETIYRVCDGLLVLAYLNPDLVTKSSDHCVYVEVRDYNSYGQIKTQTGCRENVHVIEEIDIEMYKMLFVDGFKIACDDKLCVNEYV